MSKVRHNSNGRFSPVGGVLDGHKKENSFKELFVSIQYTICKLLPVNMKIKPKKTTITLFMFYFNLSLPYCSCKKSFINTLYTCILYMSMFRLYILIRG